MKPISACFIGSRASNMPYSEKSALHEKLEETLRAEIIRMIWSGVSEFYTGAQTGVDMLSALLVLNIRDELMTTANLNLVLPYRDIYKRFSKLQKDNYDWILGSANTIMCLREKYTPHCYREKNRYMVEKCDYFIAVGDEGKPERETQMAVNTARKKEMNIVIINPLNFKIRKK